MWRRVDWWDDGRLSTRAWPPAVQLMRLLDLVCAGGGGSKWCVCVCFFHCYVWFVVDGVCACVCGVCVCAVCCVSRHASARVCGSNE